MVTRCGNDVETHLKHSSSVTIKSHFIHLSLCTLYTIYLQCLRTSTGCNYIRYTTVVPQLFPSIELSKIHEN